MILKVLSMRFRIDRKYNDFKGVRMREAVLIESTVILEVLSNEISDFDREYNDFEGAVE